MAKWYKLKSSGGAATRLILEGTYDEPEKELIADGEPQQLTNEQYEQYKDEFDLEEVEAPKKADAPKEEKGGE